MSTKTGRLSKRDYECLLSQRTSERSCHKSQLQGEQIPNNGLVCSRDKEQNVLCAGCNLILISKEVKDLDEFESLTDNIEAEGGVINCCYDCKFSWYCGRCSFILIREDGENFITCGVGLIRQLVDSMHGGRYDGLSSEDYHTHLQKFYASELKYYKRGYPITLRGAIFDVRKVKEIYNKPNSDLIVAEYKRYIRRCRLTSTSHDNLINRIRAFKV